MYEFYRNFYLFWNVIYNYLIYTFQWVYTFSMHVLLKNYASQNVCFQILNTMIDICNEGSIIFINVIWLYDILLLLKNNFFIKIVCSIFLVKLDQEKTKKMYENQNYFLIV